MIIREMLRIMFLILVLLIMMMTTVKTITISAAIYKKKN